MTFQSLRHTSPHHLADCWNLAFSDYHVPLQVSAEQLAGRLGAEGVRMDLSVGAFDGDRLVGFVMTATDVVDGVAASYNAGTGVVPEYRGQQLTKRIYEHMLPLLRAEGVKSNVLEVITENHRAIAVYEALGYVRARKLNCYKGRLETKTPATDFELRQLTSPDAARWQSFWDWKPSWQNSLATVALSFSELVVVGAFDENRLVGYIAYNPQQKRVPQFAVDKAYRKRGIGQQLFHHIAAHHGAELGVINVDANSTETDAFLQSLGFMHFLTQHEMTLRLD